MTDSFMIHGGRLADARAEFGGAPELWLDLSTGINPLPWPGADVMHIDWRALPDPQALPRLEARAAALFGVDPDLCCAVPGSETALRLIARLIDLPGRHAPLTYATHANAFASAQPVDGDVVDADVATTRIIANPNNPDGIVTSRATLMAMLEAQEAGGGWLIVDEAFADCTPQWSVADSVADHRRLVILRSFGKFFGLAGVRLGFVIGPRAILSPLRAMLGDWPVNAAALTLGMAAYGDRAWIDEMRGILPVRMAHLHAMLRRHRLTPMGDCPLFTLIEAQDAPALFRSLARQQVLTRPFAGHDRLLRLGLPGDDRAMDRLDAALRRAMAHG